MSQHIFEERYREGGAEAARIGGRLREVHGDSRPSTTDRLEARRLLEESAEEEEDKETGVEVVTVGLDEKHKGEMKYLKGKVDAGAQSVITQMFIDLQVHFELFEGRRE